MAGGDTIPTTVAIPTAVTIPVPTTVTIPGSSTGSSTAATTTTATSAAFGQRRACRQSSDCESEHEHSESCHVARLPETISITPDWVSTC
jgi:hypothetical protein